VFGVADVDVDVGAFAFQVAGVDVVAVMFTGASVTGSVAYDVAGMRREGDEAKDLPNVMYPSPLRQPFFASAARASHWPHLAFDAVIVLNEGGCWGLCHDVHRHTLCGMGYVRRGLQGESAGRGPNMVVVDQQ